MWMDTGMFLILEHQNNLQWKMRGMEMMQQKHTYDKYTT